MFRVGSQMLKECKQCKLSMPENARSKMFIGYCKHCAGGIRDVFLLIGLVIS